MITIDEDRIDHIFRDADGHFRHDTMDNRRSLVEVANREQNLLGTDRFGNDWYAEMRDNGAQIWAQVRADKIMNGGVNMTPYDFSFLTGRSR